MIILCCWFLILSFVRLPILPPVFVGLFGVASPPEIEVGYCVSTSLLSAAAGSCRATMSSSAATGSFGAAMYFSAATGSCSAVASFFGSPQWGTRQ